MPAGQRLGAGLPIAGDTGNLGSISMEHFYQDTDKWESQVESLIGPTDIILFPFGGDIGDWHPYASDNQRFQISL